MLPVKNSYGFISYRKLFTGVTASAYAANPFSDVPAGHWAYDSINKLAAAGVIEGYGDSTFGGDKLMTRYEMTSWLLNSLTNWTTWAFALLTSRKKLTT